MVAAAVVGAGIAGSALSSNSQKKAANTAADATTESNAAAIAQQKYQFDEVQKLLAPYVNAGNAGLAGQQDLLGLNGAGAQQSAISGIQSSPAFLSALKQGENSILSNASATGGLRGGNTQAALAQFSPALLTQLIQQQYGNLGGLTNIGQNAAAGVGNAGSATSNNISNLLTSTGAANAANAMAQGQASSNLYGSLGGAAGAFAGFGGFGNAGGGAGLSGIGNMGSLGSTNYGLGSGSSGLGLRF